MIVGFDPVTAPPPPKPPPPPPPPKPKPAPVAAAKLDTVSLVPPQQTDLSSALLTANASAAQSSLHRSATGSPIDDRAINAGIDSWTNRPVHSCAQPTPASRSGRKRGARS
jgi:hypothetical protein